MNSDCQSEAKMGSDLKSEVKTGFVSICGFTPKIKEVI
jgi:hypothetical protein